MIKLYKRDDDGVLLFHESWADPSDQTVANHWGRVGERGDVRYYSIPDGVSDEECIEDMLTEPRKLGYSELSERDHSVVEVQYDLEDAWGTSADLALRNAIDDLLNDELGWHGLGQWIGSSMGSGQMEIAYHVVDVDLAIEVITSVLERSQFPMYSRINVTARDDDEPG